MQWSTSMPSSKPVEWIMPHICKHVRANQLHGYCHLFANLSESQQGHWFWDPHAVHSNMIQNACSDPDDVAVWNQAQDEIWEAQI
jgi:hypothetical protein